MNTTQKVIKALAIALAAFIIFMIISSIVGLIGAITGLRFLTGLFTTDVEVEDVLQVYNVAEVKRIDIDTNIADLNILVGDEFKIEAKDVVKGFTHELNNGTLKIKEKTIKNVINTNLEGSVINIYIPKDTVFEVVEMDAGIGDTKVEELRANTMDIETGVGNVEIDYIEAKQKLDISCGVGNFEIRNSVINNLEFDAGVGHYNITSYLTGYSQIESGVGDGRITLLEFSENTHKINVEKGVGNIILNGEKMSNNSSFGNGEHYLKIEGGVGNIDINTNK